MMVTISLLQTISPHPRIVRAESGATATIYWGVACVLDLLLYVAMLIPLGRSMIVEYDSMAKHNEPYHLAEAEVVTMFM